MAPDGGGVYVTGEGEFQSSTFYQTVATETHRRWAEFLNRRVGELFGTLGTRIELVRFGDDLDFSVKPVGGPMLVRGKADHQLSHGARDQLYLAVRAAISEFLSRGAGPLPLLLDDVFATSDDDRTRCGMGLLLERLARRAIAVAGRTKRR